MHTRKAIHALDNMDKFTFNAEDYSAFKYGSMRATRNIASEMARLFASSISPQISKEIVVTGGAYKHVPTASTLLKDEFVKYLNEINYLVGREPVSSVRMYRESIYSADYSKRDIIGRAELLADDIFYIDRSYLKNKHLVSIDDICVTGIHETMVTTAIANSCDTTYLYYIDTCEEIAQLNPQIEDNINSAVVKDVYDLLNLMYASINTGGYTLTTRALKLLLGAEELEFTLVVSRLIELDLIEEVFHAAIGNNYQSVDRYKENIGYLMTKL